MSNTSIWKALPDKNVQHIWKDTATGEEFAVSPTFYQENGTPIDDEGDDCEYLRTEIINEEAEPEQIVNLKEFDDIHGGHTENARKLDININEEGIRIRLSKTGVDPDNRPDIYLEARPGGWKIFAHANQNEEPFASVTFNDDGEHEVYQDLENIPEA